MEEKSIVRMEMEISAQRIMNAFQLYNKDIEAQMEAGIKKAVEQFDFEAEIADKVKRVIRQSFLESSTYSAIKQRIDAKINDFIDANIDNIISDLNVPNVPPVPYNQPLIR